MALLAVGDITMGIAMTICALQAGMFFSRSQKHFRGLLVAACAGSRRSILAEVDLGRFMDRVTTGTARIFNKSHMRFIVTLDTFGNITVAAVVTAVAAFLTVCTGILLNLSGLLRVTLCTILRQSCHIHQPGNRRVGVAMTIEAFFEIGSVNLTVTGFTLRNSLLPAAARTVGMECFVTLPTLLPVQPTVVANGIEHRFVATGTLKGCQWNHLLGVGIGFI